MMVVGRVGGMLRYRIHSTVEFVVVVVVMGVCVCGVCVVCVCVCVCCWRRRLNGQSGHRLLRVESGLVTI